MANLANGDVIGHTQNREAKIACAELVDARLGQMVSAALAADYVVLVTADHGNLEEMTKPDGTPHVSHTANPVPFLVVDPRRTSATSTCATAGWPTSRRRCWRRSALRRRARWTG